MTQAITAMLASLAVMAMALFIVLIYTKPKK